MRYQSLFFSLLLISLGSLSSQLLFAEQNDPPEGFVALFNGKDLSGWRGQPHFDPAQLAKMPADQRTKWQVQQDADLAKHWRVENGELVNDGHGVFCTTAKDYGDFELRLDYKTVAKADSGIYLRGTPQVQIWDTTKAGGKWNRGANFGSGGLWNNEKYERFPLVHADKPFGEWNSMRITMIGEKVTVYLNDRLVVDQVPLENFWDRSKPVYETGPIQLQTHGGEIRFRNVFLREITDPEKEQAALETNKKAAAADTAPLSADEEGFVPLFTGKDTPGWTRGVHFNDETFGGRGWYTARKFGDFVLRFEFKLVANANSGIGIRSEVNTDAAYHGMEIQVLDDSGSNFRSIKPWQHHGSIYGICAAEPGHLKPLGEWNSQEIYAQGNRIRATLNDKVIVDCDIKEATQGGKRTLSGKRHPGLFNADGYLAILGHGGRVEFRNMRIKELK